MRDSVKGLILVGLAVLLVGTMIGSLVLLHQANDRACKEYATARGYSFLFTDANNQCWGEKNGTEWRLY